MTEPFDPGLSALYRRTAKDQPDKASDTLIKQLAHDAVKRQDKSTWGLRWAAAATLVLSVGVGWQVWQQVDVVPEVMIEALPAEGQVKKQTVAKPAPAAALQESVPQADYVQMQPEAKQQRGRALELHRKEQTRIRSHKKIMDAPCGQIGLHFAADPEKWRLAIVDLQIKGDKVQADCMIRAYEQRFGEWKMPEKAK